MDGAANPHDILKVLGEKELARYMVDEVQEVYRLQGVKINDKHIETIVRQMLRRVRVSEVGDTTFLVDEQVEKSMFDAENERVNTAGGKPATGEPLLLGITKASPRPIVHLRFLVPGDDESAHRGGDQREDRSPPRLEGERDHGPPHPGGDGPQRVQAPRHRGGDAGRRGRSGGRGPGHRRWGGDPGGGHGRRRGAVASSDVRSSKAGAPGNRGAPSIRSCPIWPVALPGHFLELLRSTQDQDRAENFAVDPGRSRSQHDPPCGSLPS
jgi:hypothetical protein